MLMLNWSEAYRTFIYLNVLLVLANAWPSRHDPVMRSGAIAILSFPLMLTVLHMLAVGKPEVIKEVRHLWLAGFVCLSTLMFLRKYKGMLGLFFPRACLAALILVYCLAQVMALLVLDRPYGTTKNPHYLALYSALGIPLILYLLAVSAHQWRLILIAILLSLGAFVLHTWSRPAWIALVMSGLLILLFLDNRKRLLAGVLILALTLVLFISNLAGFGDRVTDLALNIQKEERVVIWQDAWRMQQSSSLAQWLIGHGLDSYEVDFQSFSQFKTSVNFNSPHNSFLEVIYISGIFGLGICIWLYSWLYRQLWRLITSGDGKRRPALALMAVVTINLLFIMLTIPFVSHYNMFTLAFAIGLIFYWKHTPARFS